MNRATGQRPSFLFRGAISPRTRGCRLRPDRPIICGWGLSSKSKADASGESRIITTCPTGSGRWALDLNLLRSGQNFPHDITINIGETKIAPGVSVGEFLVINPEEMQNRRVDVMNVHGLFLRFKSEFVG